MTIVAGQADEILAAAKMLAEALRNPYVLGYRPKNTARDGTWRKIGVKVVLPNGSKAHHVYARAGYFAPNVPKATSAISGKGIVVGEKSSYH
jgi:hypothetical protein